MIVTLIDRTDTTSTLIYQGITNISIYRGQDGSDTPADFAKMVGRGTDGELTFNLKRFWMDVREE